MLCSSILAQGVCIGPAADESSESGLATAALVAIGLRCEFWACLGQMSVLGNDGDGRDQGWLLAVKLELTDKVNLLLHELRLDLAPRDHCLAHVATQ